MKHLAFVILSAINFMLFPWGLVVHSYEMGPLIIAAVIAEVVLAGAFYIRPTKKPDAAN